jgi:L-threonylcarbamoyladenylate synthase
MSAAAPPAGAPTAAPAPADLAPAVARLRAGGLVAFPTETLWGLGADATSEAAMARLRAWKGRDAGQPVAVLVTGVEALAALGIALPAAARRLAAAFWPGPLTLVVPAPPGRFAAGVARADGAVGLRCSPHPTAAALAAALARAGVGPLTATSLNRHGEPPARTRAEAAALCAGSDAVACLDAGPDAGAASGPALASTVVDCTGPAPVVLRAGAVDAAALSRALEQEIAAP